MNPIEKKRVLKTIEKFMGDPTLSIDVNFERNSVEEAEELAEKLSKSLDFPSKKIEHKEHSWIDIYINQDVIFGVNITDVEPEDE